MKFLAGDREKPYLCSMNYLKLLAIIVPLADIFCLCWNYKKRKKAQDSVPAEKYMELYKECLGAKFMVFLFCLYFFIQKMAA